MTEVSTTVSEGGAGPTGDIAGASMVFGMRLLLSVSAVLTLIIAPADLGVLGQLSRAIFVGYLIHSSVLLLASRHLRNPFWHGKLVYWLDLGWYALMVYSSGGGNSFFTPFFFFVILTTSFQWGFDEGARIALASTVLATLAALAVDLHTDVGHLLLRATFLLGLGYMIAYWGGLSLTQRLRLGLLRDVSRLSNPRFGVDQTIATLLEQTRQFYQASQCILLTRDTDSEHWLLRSANGQHTGRPTAVSRLSPAAAAPLLAFPAQQTVLYVAALSAHLGWTRIACAIERGQRRWLNLDCAPCAQLADLFDATAFISAPLPLRKSEGRIYVVSRSHRFLRSDATFLHHLSAQAFPVIENIELLDRMASDAAFRERQKIARDLHDSTIQPYIGLRHALSAIRQQAAADNPLLEQLDKLIAMSNEVVGDMRNFARTVRGNQRDNEPELLVALRRQATQMHEFYEIELTVEAAAGLTVSDRLAAEVFQIVNEGMSNIRKHTRARQGRIDLRDAGGSLHISIVNDNPDGLAVDFLPGSIAERAVALGGTVRVETLADGQTAVRVAIPV